MYAGRIDEPGRRTGSALVITLMFVALFASMAVALAVASDANLAISRNYREINQAYNLVESGLLLAQCEMGNLKVTGDNAAALNATLASHFQVAWANAAMIDAQAISAGNVGVVFPAIIVPGPDDRMGNIMLRIAADGGVEAEPTVTVTSEGRFGEARRAATYDFQVRSGYRIFSDYGIASRSPIVMDGGATIDGANDPSEGSIYSSSGSAPQAIYMDGTTHITGNAAVSAEGAGIFQGSDANIDGEQVTDAPEFEFPTINTAEFEQYVECAYSGSGTEEDGTFANIRILPNTNPTFNGNTNLYGVIYIESPNKVTFNGNANICGVIVCQEPTLENYKKNSLTFNGNLTAAGVEYLPNDARYNGLREKTGTFLLAPGFGASFNGNFTTINGYVAASKLKFAGTASGTVCGGIVNLADTNFSLLGGAHLTIDKKNAEKHPAGFNRRYSLICVAGSYRE